MNNIVLGKEMSNVYRKNMQRMNDSMSDRLGQELSPVHARVICFLIEGGPDKIIIQRDIEQFFGVSRATVSVFLTKMQKNGLIERYSLEGDARRRRIVPTQKAIKIHHQMTDVFRSVEEKMKQTLTPEQITTFAEVCREIEKNLDEC